MNHSENSSVQYVTIIPGKAKSESFYEKNICYDSIIISSTTGIR